MTTDGHIQADTPEVYDLLRDLAARQMRTERLDHTLSPTALVHEAYVKLIGTSTPDWQGRTHFIATAVKVMQHHLIDHGRARQAKKRGPDWQRVSLTGIMRDEETTVFDADAVEAALEEMARLDPRGTEVVCLRILGGLTVMETAKVLDISTRSVERDLKMGITWLRSRLSEPDA